MFLLIKQVFSLYLSNIKSFFPFLLALMAASVLVEYFVLSEIVPNDNKGVMVLCFYSFALLVETIYVYVLISFFNDRVSGNRKNIVAYLKLTPSIYLKLFSVIVATTAITALTGMAGGWSSIVLFFPLIYLLTRCSFSNFYIRLKGLDVYSAVKLSWSETREYQWLILGSVFLSIVPMVLSVELLKAGVSYLTENFFVDKITTETFRAMLITFYLVLFFRFYSLAENIKETQANESLKNDVELDPA